MTIGTGDLIRVAVVFPSYYRIGMTNLGFQLVYSIFNCVPGVCCHRVFLPDPDQEKALIAQGSILRSMETFEPLCNYDLLAFSISYENNLPDLIRILELGHVPLKSIDRTSRDPIVIAGGVVATINPEPVADFLDACVLGEGEVVIPELITALTSSWVSDRDRTSAVNTLARIPGVYVPSFYSPNYTDTGKFLGMTYTGPSPEPEITHRTVTDIDSINGAQVIHTPHSEFPDLHLVEISRGCPRHCRFCLIPHCYQSFRPRAMTAVLEEATLAPPGYRIGLLGAGAADHPDLFAICSRLTEMNIRFSFSSLHASSLTPDFLRLIAEFGPRTLTLAPETGSDRRRKKIGKDITNEELIHAVRLAGKPPTKIIKLYFMIGLPGETPDDIDDIAELCQKLSHELRVVNRTSKTIPRIAAGVSCFVPKARSPFQRAAMLDEKALKNRLKRLTQLLKTSREIHLTHDVPKWAVVQGWIARGDRRLGDTLAMAASRNVSWRSLMKQSPLNFGYVLHRTRPLSEPLPWDHL